MDGAKIGGANMEKLRGRLRSRGDSGPYR